MPVTSRTFRPARSAWPESSSGVTNRSIGAWQIWLINNRRLPDGFKVSRLNTTLLWITVVTGLGGVAYWAVTVLPVEACKQAKLLCP